MKLTYKTNSQHRGGIKDGVLTVYMTGGLTELHNADPKEIDEPEILDQINTWHQIK